MVVPVAAPTKDTDDGIFQLCDGELFLFDTWAHEHVNIAGVDFELFHLDIEESTVDPVYNETVERVFQGSFELRGYFEFPPGVPETTEQGSHVDWESSLWIPRKELEEKHAPVPAEDDIIRVWRTPFFKTYGVFEQEIPDSGYFFDVTVVDEDGHLFDRSSFVGVKLTLKRRTEYTPERRLEND
jgi:hypothetical protein